MTTPRYLNSAGKISAAVLGAAAGVYAALAATAFVRYGRPRAPAPNEADALLDRFMPRYDVVERHHIRIAAPPAIVMETARRMNLNRSRIIRAIFRGRELLLGATPGERGATGGLLVEMQTIGWRVLADVPDREVVVGAVTRPWEPNVTFRPIPPDEFAAFAEPGYVKILWTLRADPAAGNTSVFRTETRVATTDATARARFRRYWSAFAPGIVLIRWLLLAPLKADAERVSAARR